MTRTRQTERAYRKRAGELIKRIAEAFQMTEEAIAAKECVRWLLQNRERWTAATFRQYRSALSFHYGSRSPRDGEAISLVSQERLGVRPKHGQTSSGKKKCIPPARAKRLLTALREHGGLWESLAADVFECTIETGLRPIEWNSARLVGNRLIVTNAKATNGRGNGKFREIELDAEAAERAEALIKRIQELPKGTRWHDSARVALRSVRLEIYPKSQYTLYTARHQFSANAKAINSREAVAELMGHNSIKTAKVHYGKRKSAWSKLTSPKHLL